MAQIELKNKLIKSLQINKTQGKGNIMKHWYDCYKGKQAYKKWLKESRKIRLDKARADKKKSKQA